MRPHRGDEAISLQFRDFAGNGLDRQAEVIGYVQASERNVDLDRGDNTRPGPTGDAQEEGGDPLICRRPTETDDVILRGLDLAGDVGEKQRAEVRVAVDELIKAGAAAGV